MSTQISMSDMLLDLIRHDIDRFTYQECARYSIKFFLRQLGVPDDTSDGVIAEAERIFETLPIDNRYNRNFAYDGKHLIVSPE